MQGVRRILGVYFNFVFFSINRRFSFFDGPDLVTSLLYGNC